MNAASDEEDALLKGGRFSRKPLALFRSPASLNGARGSRGAARGGSKGAREDHDGFAGTICS